MMPKIFVIRTGPPYYETIINKVKNGIPKQQIFNPDIDELEKVKDKLKYIPIFADYYVITVNYKRKKEFNEFLKWCYSLDYIKVIILCDRSDTYLNLLAYCENHQMEVFKYNTYKATKEERNNYIIRTMKTINPSVYLTGNLVDTIRKRLYGYSGEVYGYLQKLANMKLSQKVIRDTIPKRENLNINSFGFNCYSDTSLAKLDNLIFNCRFYPMVLVDSLSNYTEKIMNLYKPFINGEFTEYNYVDFVASKGNKFGLNNEFSALAILDILSNLSYPKLLIIQTMLSDCTKYNRANTILNLYKIIRIIRSNSIS